MPGKAATATSWDPLVLPDNRADQPLPTTGLIRCIWNNAITEMKIIHWLGIAFLWMLPLNFLLLTTAKLMSGNALGNEEIVGFGVALFGLMAGGILYRRRPR